jgi:hypothetical protein
MKEKEKNVKWKARLDAPRSSNKPPRRRGAHRLKPLEGSFLL